jgi:hypothetical protein
MSVGWNPHFRNTVKTIVRPIQSWHSFCSHSSLLHISASFPFLFCHAVAATPLLYWRAASLLKVLLPGGAHYSPIRGRLLRSGASGDCSRLYSPGMGLQLARYLPVDNTGYAVATAARLNSSRAAEDSNSRGYNLLAAAAAAARICCAATASVLRSGPGARHVASWTPRHNITMQPRGAPVAFRTATNIACLQATKKKTKKGTCVRYLQGRADYSRSLGEAITTLYVPEDTETYPNESERNIKQNRQEDRGKLASGKRQCTRACVPVYVFAGR